tara:strand:- start:41 stop:1231 length:1191 start_codon:yes stop_codon:yes gene_type:complete
MKKVLILLLLLLVACGGSSEETAVNDTTTTTVQDTTTTTIPPLPTIGFDIIENYNLKLVDELCLGSESIDTVTESCLKQYREDLEWLTRYNDQIQEYVNELNQYFEQYPEQLTEEYSSYLSFVKNEYSAVFTDYEIVSDKYIERFGGTPNLTSILFTESNLISWCPADFAFQTNESFKTGTITFKNQLNEYISMTIDQNVTKTLNVTGGLFQIENIAAENYLGEKFVLDGSDFNTQFTVQNFAPMITTVGFETISSNYVLKVGFKSGAAKVKKVWAYFERKSIDNGWQTALSTDQNALPIYQGTMLYDDYAIISLGSDIPKGEEPIKLRWLKVSFDMNNTNGTEFQEFASGEDIVTLKNCSNDKNNFQGISGRDSDFQINNSAFQQFLNVELIVND